MAGVETAGAEDAAPAPLAEPLRVVIRPMALAADDLRLAHKTTDRACYDQPRIDAKAQCGADEVLFTDSDGALTEGSFTAVFVERDGKLLTPPLSNGLLPSVLRRALIESGEAIEAELSVTDLTAGFFVGNSLRGLLPAKRVAKFSNSR